jgi:predicted metal-binding protein
MWIYTSYTLNYPVFNATLSFSFLFSLRHVSAAMGHHQVFCCQSCLTVIRPNAAETCRRLNKKEKLKVALTTVYFSVYEVYINATGCLNIICVYIHSLPHTSS